MEKSTEGSEPKPPLRKGKLTLDDLVLFNCQLAALVEAELPLSQGLRAIARDAATENFKAVVEQLTAEVERGKSFSQALAGRPEVFPQVYVNMVRAGEKSGDLAGVLEELTDYSESQERLQHGVRTAFVYPLIISLLAVVVISLVTIIVGRSWHGLTVEMGAFDVPMPFLLKPVSLQTKIAPGLAIPWPVLLLSGIGVILALFVVFISIAAFVEPGTRRGIFTRFNLRIPILSRATRSACVASFSRTLSMLLSRDYPLPEALRLLAGTSEVKEMSRLTAQAAKEVEEGGTLGESVQKFHLFPQTARWLIASAERKGNLAEELASLGQDYAERSESAARQFVAALEIWLIVVVGLVVLSAGGSFFLYVMNFMRLVGWFFGGP